MDPFQALGQVARVFEAVPVATRVGAAVHRAAFHRCDLCRNTGYIRLADGPNAGQVRACPCVDDRGSAIDYLRNHGWAEALDVWQPGLGSAIRTGFERGAAAMTETHAIVHGRVIDSTFRELPKPEWEDFGRALDGITWGSFPIFGRRGGGKTQTALRMAEKYHKLRRYPVFAVNLWPEDLPSWVQPISLELLQRWVRVAQDALRLPKTEDELVRTEALGGGYLDPAKLAALEGIKRRVILIDEASLEDLSPNSPAMLAAVRAMAIARHLDWIVLYVGQLMSMLPRGILTSDTLAFKEPTGETQGQFDRDNPAARHLWARAALAFQRIRSSPWYSGVYADTRAWTFWVANYPIPFEGMMPMRLPEAA